MYHSQKLAVRGISQHPLGVVSSLGFFHLTLSKTHHVLSNHVDGVLDKAQCNFSLQFLEVEEWHSVGVFTHDNVVVICVDDEISCVHSLLGMVGDWPYHLEYLQ
jgi:hypothetical protein